MSRSLRSIHSLADDLPIPDQLIYIKSAEMENEAQAIRFSGPLVFEKSFGDKRSALLDSRSGSSQKRKPLASNRPDSAP